MKKTIVGLTMFSIIVLMLNACYYDEAVVFEGVPTNVSLKNDVSPILQKNCTTTGCHDANVSHEPSLVSDNLYKSLVTGGYVNINEPEKSKIYQAINGGGMPPSGSLKSNDLKIILGWITDGAKNN